MWPCPCVRRNKNFLQQEIQVSFQFREEGVSKMTSRGKLEERPTWFLNDIVIKATLVLFWRQFFLERATRTISDTEPCYVKKSHIQGNCERGPWLTLTIQCFYIMKKVGTLNTKACERCFIQYPCDYTVVLNMHGSLSEIALQQNFVTVIRLIITCIVCI